MLSNPSLDMKDRKKKEREPTGIFNMEKQNDEELGRNVGDTGAGGPFFFPRGGALQRGLPNGRCASWSWVSNVACVLVYPWRFGKPKPKSVVQ